MAVGEWTNFAGTAIEAVYLFSQGKDKEGLTKLGISLFFIGTGKLGAWETEKVAKKEAVEQGLNTSAETVVGGANTIMEKTIGKGTEDKITK